MSYATRIDGEMTFTPPLPWRAVRDSPLLPENVTDRHTPDTLLVVSTQTEERDDGRIEIKTAEHLRPNWRADSTGGRCVVDEVQSLLDANPDHDLTGSFECFGDEPGDIWRVVIRERRAVREDAEIRWPSSTGS